MTRQCLDCTIYSDSGIKFYGKRCAKCCAKRYKSTRAAYNALKPEVNKKSIKKYKLKNRDKINKKYNLWANYQYQNNAKFRLKKLLRGRIRRAIKYQYSLKSYKTNDLLGLSVPDFMIYLEKLFKPGMSWNNMELWHIDHIKPCCSFDLSNSTEQKICFNYQNLQPLWKHENLSKRTQDLKLKHPLVKSKDVHSINPGKL